LSANWSRFQPAQVVQYSGGADNRERPFSRRSPKLGSPGLEHATSDVIEREKGFYGSRRVTTRGAAVYGASVSSTGSSRLRVKWPRIGVGAKDARTPRRGKQPLGRLTTSGLLRSSGLSRRRILDPPAAKLTPCREEQAEDAER